jgi:hypothetical protein
VLVDLVACVLILWFGQAFALSQIMNGRGFHPLPWFAVASLLGPAMWPFALLEALSGPPPPDVIRPARPAAGAIDVSSCSIGMSCLIRSPLR